MEKYLNKFYNIIDKIGKQNFVLITFILAALITTGLFQTFSIYTQVAEGVVNGIKTYTFILDAENTTNSVTIAAGNSKNMDITITNDSNTKLQYGLYYSTDDLSTVHIGYLTNTKYLPNGNIDGNNRYVITLRVDNLTDESITINFGLKYGFLSGGDLVLDDDQYWLDAYSTQNLLNKPNLDGGNLIPVYYDDTAGVETWKVADENNIDNSWYDYENKMWANAVIIDPNATTDYSVVNTPVVEDDIIAYYVWIPRYKYRVWNINRQAGDESTYAYPAYSTGIEIEFEQGTSSTGNVECTYDVTTEESEANLSDVCVYNGTDTITTESVNSNYQDAWYTHPAFTFGTEEKTGFWIGKFETGGTADAPKVLPDISSLSSQDVSTQFTTSKKFQSYLSNGLDAHMLTNLEWGAVAYLTHSIYGLCDSSSCGGVFQNNSSGFFTGRSGGAIAGSTDLNLTNVYGSNVTTKTTQYNANGYYNYKGYFIDYDGNVTTTKDITKVASSTRNITGVYDISGGAYEYVMGNMVNSNDDFYSSSGGSAWNGTNWYDATNSSLYNKYYSSYSYGTNAYGTIGFNRARLGDATSETLGASTSDSGSWKLGSGITGSNSVFVSGSYSWFSRGGYYYGEDSGVFNFSRDNGTSSNVYSFRSALS